MTENMTAIPAKLHVGADGKLSGPGFHCSYNDPWPCANGTPGGGASQMMGVIEHTMVGTLRSTIEWFNNPASQASAFLGIEEDGHAHQFGPVGANWMAWAQAAGNPMWYSFEFADRGDPSRPLTADQIATGAQALECLSRFGFPLQVTDSTDVKGFGTHGMGGVPWGNHPQCPGPVRAAQRHEMVALAKQIRAGAQQPQEIHCPHGQWTKVGNVEVQPATHDVVLQVR